MKYITDRQLEKEIEHPLVTDVKTDSIAKYIKSRNHVNAEMWYKRKYYVEPTRPLVTKFYDYESTTNLN